MLDRVLGILSADLAIDLGAANTLIGVPGRGLVLNEPSVVAFPLGQRPAAADVAVGHLARQMIGRAPGSISVVRPISRGVITDFHLCEAMLRYFLRKVRPSRWHSRPRVLIGIPGSITPVEKRAVLNSAQRAGARQALLIPKVKAAAVGVGLPLAEPLGSMVIDIGGSTTEIAVLSMGDIVSSRSIRVGGDHMDQAIVDDLRRRHGLKVGLATAEQLRMDIGSAFPLEQEPVEEVAGVDAASGLPRRITVGSEEIRAALAEPLDEIVEAIRQTLDQCSPDLAADLVGQGVVLCGGGSLLRSLERFIAERTGLPARLAAEPMTAVAKGTLVCLENLEQWRHALESSDDDV